MDPLCREIGEEMIDLQDMIRIFWTLISSLSTKTAQSEESSLLIEEIFIHQMQYELKYIHIVVKPHLLIHIKKEKSALLSR